jgi:hypothetical protein
MKKIIYDICIIVFYLNTLFWVKQDERNVITHSNKLVH